MFFPLKFLLCHFFLYKILSSILSHSILTITLWVSMAGILIIILVKQLKYEYLQWHVNSPMANGWYKNLFCSTPTPNLKNCGVLKFEIFLCGGEKLKYLLQEYNIVHFKKLELIKIINWMNKSAKWLREYCSC